MNCNEEVTVKLVGKLTLEIPQLEQIKIRDLIDGILANYEIFPVEKSLITSDIEEKIRYFLVSKKIDGASPITLYTYKLQLMKFASIIHKPVRSITVIDIRMYLALISKNAKSTTINSKISILKSFFKWLEDEEMILRNPMKKIKNTKKAKRLRKALTQNELELLRDACKTTRQRAILEFLFSTGCRLQEMVNANVKDIKWDKLELNVIGKGNKERTVYLNSKSKLYLEKYLNERKNIDNPSLFITSKHPYKRLGNRSVEREINKIGYQAGFAKSIYPHLIRHTTATIALSKGMNITFIQRLLGHEDINTILIYSEVNNDLVKKEYKKIFK